MENRTGRFIAQRRKELKMTQKELLYSKNGLQRPVTFPVMKA